MCDGVTTTLPDVCALVTDGTHDSPPLQTEGVPFIKGKHISSGRIDFDTCDFITEEDHAKCIKRVKPQIDDVLFANIGSVGDVARVTEDREFSIKNVALFRPDLSKVDPTYFYYLVLSPAFRGVFLNVRSGAAQPFISLDTFRSHKFPYNPNKAQQQRIGQTLLAYDELIENNRRRMRLLEEAARLLYREWFVRFRFPGHERVCILHGIPHQWSVYAADHLCAVGRGASPRPIANFMEGEIPWFKIGDATASDGLYIFETQEHVTENGAKKSITLEPRSLILSNSATCGIPYFTGVRGCVHDGWLHFTNFRRVSQEFLYCYFYFKRDELVSSVGEGSTQKNLNTMAVGRLKVVLPTDDVLLKQFDDAAQPMFSTLFNLAQQNQKLRAARDLLLPRLMSGQIKVRTEKG